MMPAWLFAADQHLTVGQECARATLVFLYGLVLVRLAGRRLFGKWSALDFIVSIIIGSSLSRALTGNAPLAGTLIATTGMLVLHWLFAQAAARSPRLSYWLEGRAVELAVHGQVDDHVRVRHGVSHADLDEALRQHGLDTADQAERVTLEPSGSMTVLKRS